MEKYNGAAQATGDNKIQRIHFEYRATEAIKHTVNK
jgi:hypothetical protein